MAALATNAFNLYNGPVQRKNKVKEQTKALLFWVYEDIEKTIFGQMSGGTREYALLKFVTITIRFGVV